MLEDRRQGAEETRIFLLPLIHRGGIAKHGERRVIDDIGGQLMATCALAHRGAVGGIPIAPGGIAHGSRRIIDEAALQTDEREGDVVARHIHLLGTPFHLLHSEHALVVDDIGEGAVQARGRVEAVIIEGEMILGALPGNAIGHFGGSLVVAVEEIDLEASDAHGRILSASLFKLVVEHIEDGPKHQSYITLGSISDEFLQIERRDNRQHITCGRLVPTFVEHHKLDAVSRRKVDVIAIGIHVDARLEGHTREVPVVPPVPSHLSCLDPRGVADAVLRSQGIDKIGDGHFAIVACDAKDSPGEGACAETFGNVVAALLHITHLAPGVIGHFGRIGSKFGIERTLLCLHKHTGISLDITFEQSHLGLPAIDRHGQERGTLLCPGQWSLVVEVLECHRIGFLLVGRIGEPGRRIAPESIMCLLIIYNIRVRKAAIETIGHSFVIGTEHDTETRLEAQVQFVALHRETALTIERGIDGLADLATPCRLHLAGLDARAIAQSQADARLGKQGVAVLRQEETELLTIGLHLNIQSSIGRLQVITDCQKHDTEERK